MKKLTFTVIALAGGLQFSSPVDASSAGQSTPPEAQPSSEAAPAAPVIELKNKSAFVTQESGRNPFWPIGWKPAAKQSAATNAAIAEPAGPEVAPSAFVVSSIVMDPRAPFAIINGKVMTQGQVFGLQMGSSTYQITVKAIEDGRVILVRGRDSEIIVPLRRR